MNRKLSYNGKAVYEMTEKELSQQLEVNKRRITVNNLFVAVITGTSLVVCAPAAILVIIIGVLRRNWLLENNKVLREELNQR